MSLCFSSFPGLLLHDVSGEQLVKLLRQGSSVYRVRYLLMRLVGRTRKTKRLSSYVYHTGTICLAWGVCIETAFRAYSIKKKPHLLPYEVVCCT